MAQCNSLLGRRPRDCVAPLLATAAALLTRPELGHAQWRMAEPVSVLASRVEVYLQRHPDDARGHYVLARIHGLALRLNSTELLREGRRSWGRLPTVVDEDVRRENPRRWGPPPTRSTPTEFERRRHLRTAIEHYQRAIELDPDRPEAYLELGAVLECGAAMVDTVDVLPQVGDPPATQPAPAADIEPLIRRLGSPDFNARNIAQRALENRLDSAVPILMRCRTDPDAEIRVRTAQLLQVYWHQQAIRCYRCAFERSIESDQKQTWDENDYGRAPSVQAAYAYARLVGAREDSSEHRAGLDRMEVELKKIKIEAP